ncbi:MAG: hypothetical protein CL537_14565 [Alcanivoracaceae bacterium]|nr:hypothetical protein [Alcanivoracaceae bacterium]|tara:strand:- start:167 stop:394 length:228 start_codon:yes stop_codon:yes gene_type:complete
MNSLNTFCQGLMARLYARSSGGARKQRGASALEYIVLAAALIIIIGVAVANGAGDALTGAFTDLFSDAAAGGGEG